VKARGEHVVEQRAQVGAGADAHCISAVVGGGMPQRLVLGDTFLRAYYSVYTYEPVSGAAWVALAPAALGAGAARPGAGPGPASGAANASALDAAASAAAVADLAGGGLGAPAGAALAPLGPQGALGAPARAAPPAWRAAAGHGWAPAGGARAGEGPASPLAGAPREWGGRGAAVSRLYDAPLSYAAGGTATLPGGLAGAGGFLGVGSHLEASGGRRMLCARR